MKIVIFFLGMEGASQNGDGGGGGLRWIKSLTVSNLCASPPANHRDLHHRKEQRHLQTGSPVVSAPKVQEGGSAQQKKRRGDPQDVTLCGH